MLGEGLLIVGRQVPTAHGGFIDLLAVEEVDLANDLAAESGDPSRLPVDFTDPVEGTAVS